MKDLCPSFELFIYFDKLAINRRRYPYASIVYVFAAFRIFLQFIKLYPIDLHFHRQLLGVCLANPRALDLHVYEQVVRSAEWVLPLVCRFYAWI